MPNTGLSGKSANGNKPVVSVALSDSLVQSIRADQVACFIFKAGAVKDVQCCVSSKDIVSLKSCNQKALDCVAAVSAGVQPDDSDRRKFYNAVQRALNNQSEDVSEEIRSLQHAVFFEYSLDDNGAWLRPLDINAKNDKILIKTELGVLVRKECKKQLKAQSKQAGSASYHHKRKQYDEEQEKLEQVPVYDVLDGLFSEFLNDVSGAGWVERQTMQGQEYLRNGR